jgi:hypothetical protein
MSGIALLIKNSDIDYFTAQQQDETFIVDGKSTLGFNFSSVIGSFSPFALAVGLMHTNVIQELGPENPNIQVFALRRQLFPAQSVFQKAAYRDLDQDHVGEYGSFTELMRTPEKILDGEEWNAERPIHVGYQYAIYFPNGKGGAIGANDKDPANSSDATSDATNAREEKFIIYAWPLFPNENSSIFAMTQTGTVYSIPSLELNGKEPAWNALFGGESHGWDEEPQWAPFQEQLTEEE